MTEQDETDTEVMIKIEKSMINLIFSIKEWRKKRLDLNYFEKIEKLLEELSGLILLDDRLYNSIIYNNEIKIKPNARTIFDIKTPEDLENYVGYIKMLTARC